MADDNYHGMTPLERASHLCYRLMRGEGLTAREVARQYGVSRKTAYANFLLIQRVAPVAPANGVWRATTPSAAPAPAARHQTISNSAMRLLRAAALTAEDAALAAKVAARGRAPERPDANDANDANDGPTPTTAST